MVELLICMEKMAVQSLPRAEKNSPTGEFKAMARVAKSIQYVLNTFKFGNVVDLLLVIGCF